MGGNRDLRDAILTLVNPLSVAVLMDMVVVSVDENARTAQCKTISTDAEVMLTVRLMPTVDDGVFVVPTVGSTVTVSTDVNCEPIVVGYTETDKIVLRGGQFDGLVKVAELTTKLNNAEKKINAIINAYNAHTHILTLTMGTGTAAPTVTQVVGTLTPTQQADIENENITHG